MATHSSVRVWKIPGTEESGGPQSTGPKRVVHDGGTKRPSGGRPQPAEAGGRRVPRGRGAGAPHPVEHVGAGQQHLFREDKGGLTFKLV